MDTVVVVAIIGAIAMVLSALISAFGAWILTRKKYQKEIEERERQATETSIGLQDEILQTFGYQIREVTSKVEFRNYEGAYDLTTSRKGVKITKTGVTLPRLPGTILIEHPSAQFETSPQIKNISHIPGKVAELKDEVLSDKQIRLYIQISPDGLTDSDPEFNWEYKLEAHSGLCITKEEMEEEYKDEIFKNEYFFFDVKEPIDTLNLEVVFPVGYEVKAFPAVFYYGSKIINSVELQQTKEGFDESSINPRLIIARPKIGFRYAICWVPPSSERVAQLRKGGD